MLANAATVNTLIVKSPIASINNSQYDYGALTTLLLCPYNSVLFVRSSSFIPNVTDVYNPDNNYSTLYRINYLNHLIIVENQSLHKHYVFDLK